CAGKSRQQFFQIFISTHNNNETETTRKRAKGFSGGASWRKNRAYKCDVRTSKSSFCGARRNREAIMSMTENQTEAIGQKPNAVTAPAEERGYITKEEVARRLKKTVRTIENWQRRGYIPFIKAGRSVLFDWDDVVAHLKKHFRVCHLR